MAYIFDDIHATFGDLAHARDAAARHIAALRPDDRAALFTTSGEIGLDFTADREKLQKALHGLRQHPAVHGTRCPPMSEYMADLIANRNDLEVLYSATQDTINCEFAGMKDPPTLARADRKSTRLNSSHRSLSRMPSSA